MKPGKHLLRRRRHTSYGECYRWHWSLRRAVKAIARNGCGKGSRTSKETGMVNIELRRSHHGASRPNTIPWWNFLGKDVLAEGRYTSAWRTFHWPRGACTMVPKRTDRCQVLGTWTAQEPPLRSFCSSDENVNDAKASSCNSISITEIQCRKHLQGKPPFLSKSLI